LTANDSQLVAKKQQLCLWVANPQAHVGNVEEEAQEGVANPPRNNVCPSPSQPSYGEDRLVVSETQNPARKEPLRRQLLRFAAIEDFCATSTVLKVSDVNSAESSVGRHLVVGEIAFVVRVSRSSRSSFNTSHDRLSGLIRKRTVTVSMRRPNLPSPRRLRPSWAPYYKHQRRDNGNRSCR
jgi:hypothetical protein